MTMLNQDTARRLTDSLGAANDATSPGFDLAQHLTRQKDFSLKTFGPGDRTKGVCDHIRKELIEIEDDFAAGVPTLGEWVDVIILAFDGAWRSGADPHETIAAIVAKQTKNEGRVWPDWRTSDPNKAIEHDRGFKVGDRCNWIGQSQRLVYMGKKGSRNQFALVRTPYDVWCEVLDSDLHKLEKTPIKEMT